MEFKDWLNERYEVDARARNKELETKAFQALTGKDSLKIVDLGSGTGSNFRYYHKRLPSADQYWILVDQNGQLLEEAESNILKLYPEATKVDGSLEILDAGLKVKIDFQVSDIFETDLNPTLNDSNLILSNALFDLASETQFANFVNQLPLKTAVFLTTLNYENTRFGTRDSLDAQMIENFHAHMQRPQAFGHSMGADCAKEMASALKRLAKDVSVGPSLWTLDSEEALLQKGIVEFIENALVDMHLYDEASKIWVENKRSLISNDALSIEVHHWDILSLPTD